MLTKSLGTSLTAQRAGGMFGEHLPASYRAKPAATAVTGQLEWRAFCAVDCTEGQSLITRVPPPAILASSRLFGLFTPKGLKRGFGLAEDDATGSLTFVLALGVLQHRIRLRAEILQHAVGVV
jgi:hypothetical protein